MPKSKSKKISGESSSKYYDPLWSPEKPKKKITRKLFPESDLQFNMEDLGPKGPIPAFYPSMHQLERGFMDPLEPESGNKVYPWEFKAPEVENGAKRCAKLRLECEGLAEPGAIEKWQKKIKVLHKEGQVLASKEWLAKYGEKTLEVLDTRPWHFPIKIV